MPAIQFIRQALPVVILATVLIASPGAADAQEDVTSRRAAVVDVPLLERSRLFKNVPDEHTQEYFEALLALHFRLGGSMQDSYDAASITKESDWALLPTVSMLVNLRQVKADSAPVRTPSYMPRLRLTVARTARPRPLATTTQWVFDGTFGHYSNGQDGCPFEGQARDADRQCLFLAPSTDDELKANRADGSFSSHYLEWGAAYRWMTWSDAPGASSRVPSSRIVSLYLRARDYRTPSGIGGGMSEDLRRLYGSARLRLGADAVFETDRTGFFRGPHWLGAWVEASNGHERVGKWRAAGEIGKTMDVMNGTGLFVRGYWGHDDYNIAFLQPIKVLQIGMTLGAERRPTFQR